MGEKKTQQLLKQGKKFKVHEGYVTFDNIKDDYGDKIPLSHTWITINDKILDETLEQFTHWGANLNSVQYKEDKIYTPEEYLKLIKKYPKQAAEIRKQFSHLKFKNS